MERCSSRRPASLSRRHWKRSIAAGFAPSLAFISLTCRALTTAGISTKNVNCLARTANTREDLRALLAEAVEAHVQPHTTAYALTEANRGLRDMKRSNIEGTPELAIA